MLLGLGLAAAGLGRSIWANQQKDPNRGLYQVLNKQARGLRSDASRDVGGAMSANIKNATQNELYNTRQQSAMSGRGSSPVTSAQVASIASRGAEAQNRALQYGAERSEGLTNQANQLVMARERSKSDFKNRKNSAVAEGILSGVTAGLGTLAPNPFEQYLASLRTGRQEKN